MTARKKGDNLNKKHDSIDFKFRKKNNTKKSYNSNYRAHIRSTIYLSHISYS